MGEIAKFRAIEDAEDLLESLLAALRQRARGRELVVIVRDLWRAIALSRSPLFLPPGLVQDLYVVLRSMKLTIHSFVVLVDPSVHFRARLLCSSIIRYLLHEPKLPLFRGRYIVTWY